MPDYVIQRVEALGRRDSQPNLLTFTDKQGQELLEPDPEDVSDDDLSLDSAPDDHITGVDPAPSTGTILEALIDTDSPHDLQQADISEAFEQVPNNDTVPELPQPDNQANPVQTTVEEVHDDAPHEQPPPAIVPNNNRSKFSQIQSDLHQ